jgi:hypothetical protein
MASMIRCPRCKAETDASAAKPGSIIKCVHCRGDMRVPEAAKAAAPGSRGGSGGGGGAGGGRQSTLFRRMNNASMPGQKGRGASAPAAPGRGASDRGRDLSGLYIGGGVVGIIAIIVAIGVVMSGKKEDPVKGPPKKEIAKRAPVEPPPPPPAATEPPPPPKVPDGAPVTWEPDAAGFVLESVKSISTDATAEKDALHFIRNNDTKRIMNSPFRYMPFVINNLINEDRDLAKASFNMLHAFCEERSVKFADGKNPVDMTKVNNAHYRGYIYQSMTEWWRSSASKLPDAPGNTAAVERTPQGVAYRKVKNLGRGAWLKLAELVDHEDLTIGQTASQVLTELTGEKLPRPNEQNRSEVKNAWIAWINKN